MVFRHSLRVTGSRFSLVYKSLLYIALMLLIFSAITFSAVYPVIKPIIQGIVDMQFFPHISEAFASIFSGNSDTQAQAFGQLKQDFINIGEVFANNQYNVILGLVLFLIFLMICKFFITLSRYPSGDIINHFMNSNSRYGYVSNMIANLKKAFAYSAVDTLITVPYFAIVGLIVWGLGALLIKVSLILTLTVVLTVILLLISLRSSMFALWLPTYINGDSGVFKSLADSVKVNTKIFVPNLGLYVLVYFALYAYTMLFGLVTFGIGFIFAISINRIYLISTEMVIYYRVNELKYYIDPETVINSKQVVKNIH